MFIHLSRILMAAADDSAGGGGNPAPAAGAAPAPAANVPQAQGAAITMSKEQLDALVASAAAKAVADAKDSIFAEARRTFTAPKPNAKPKSDDPPAPAPAAPTFDPLKVRALDFALTKAGIAADLTQRQYERAHRDFAAEAPDDVEAWAKEYFAGWKGSAAPAAAPASAPVTQPANPAPAAPKPPTNDNPASDRGTPPAPRVPLEEADLVAMSESDRAALIKTKGVRWYRDQLAKQLKGRRVTLRA